jgi:aminopeptidase N
MLDTLEITVPRANPYRATETRLFDLIHTALEVRFDIPHQWLYGKETVSLTPHFYPQHSLTLDAKYMDIYKVETIHANGTHSPLSYRHDTLSLSITLDRVYLANEKITLYIEYKAKPNEHKSGGSAAIMEDKGLYFINPLGKDSTEPTEIWTQGETESSSCWFPTLDKPNQKTTQEIAITIDRKYTTLSNGLLVSQKSNPDGTRTDYWRMDMPHAPYLFMMAIGDFKVIKDKWRDKEVSYYLEPAFAPYARQLFGQTTDMMEYYSTLFGVAYPWPKYAQVVVRDYVSGAMENTSATLHGEFLNRTPRQLIDEDYHDIISHELVHQWFGDLVTAESWSNITVNESFADYGEYLWNEHKYGKPYADWRGHQSLRKYMQESARGKNVNLVRFYYDNREDVFDAHSYEKGGHILHMLRHLVGDEAFFKSLQLYLSTYRYQSAEAQQLRLAFEEITGRDLSVFFNQWYYKPGHPQLTYDYRYAHDSIYVTASQHHNIDDGLLYELPIRIEARYGPVTDSHKYILTKRKQTWAFAALGVPDMIDADPDRIILCGRTENKTSTQYAYQYRYNQNILQRLEALDSLRRIQATDTLATMVCIEALHDPLPQLQAYALQTIQFGATHKVQILATVRDMAAHDPSPIVRGAAIACLGRARDTAAMPVLTHAIYDTSYAVEAQALRAILLLDTPGALRLTRQLDQHPSNDVRSVIYEVIATAGDSTYLPYLLGKLNRETSYAQYSLVRQLGEYVQRMSPEMADTAISRIKDLLEDDDDKWLHRTAVSTVEQIKASYELKAALLPSPNTAANKTLSAAYTRVAIRAREVLKAWKEEE